VEALNNEIITIAEIKQNPVNKIDTYIYFDKN
jgi:hypothetical protein